MAVAGRWRGVDGAAGAGANEGTFQIQEQRTARLRLDRGGQLNVSRLRNCADSSVQTGITALTTSAMEFELAAASMVTIAEDTAGSANPAITLYRTYNGHRPSSASGHGLLLQARDQRVLQLGQPVCVLPCLT